MLAELRRLFGKAQLMRGIQKDVNTTQVAHVAAAAASGGWRNRVYPVD